MVVGGVPVMSSEARAVIQGATLFLALLALLQFYLLVRRNVFPWRLVAIPAVVVSEIVLFYGALVIFDYSIPNANMVSAMIRLQSIAVLVVYLVYALRRRQ